MRRWNVCVMVACVAVMMVGLARGKCQADTVNINIANPGFESDVLDDGTYSPATVSGWSYPEISTAGTQNPGSSDPQQAHGGSNYAYLSHYQDPENLGGAIEQKLMLGSNPLHVIQAGNQISFSLFQGRRDPAIWGQTVQDQYFAVELWRGGDHATGTRVGYWQFGAVGINTWEQRTCDYTAVAGDVGQDLYLRLANDTYDNSPSYAQIQIDDVSGTFSAVPEPGSITVLVTGIIGLLAYAWRKRP